MHIYQLVMRVVETFAPILGMFVIFFITQSIQRHN